MVLACGMVLAFVFGLLLGLYFGERRTVRDQNRRSRWLMRSPHIWPGEPIAVQRVDPRASIQHNPWQRPDEGEEP